MIAKLLNMIKRAATSLVSDDSKARQTVQVTYIERVGDVEIIYPYGTCGSPPLNSLGILFNINGQEENQAGIFNDAPNRFKDLEEGEFVCGNYLTGSYIKFLQNGDIEAFSANDAIINVTGNATVDVGGNATVDVSGSASLTAGSTVTVEAGTDIVATAGGNATITAPTINLTGNVVISGTLSAAGGAMSATPAGMALTGTLTSNGKNISDSHTHSGVTTGGGTSGPVS